MTTLLLLLAAGANLPGALGEPWAVFSRAPALRPDATKVEVGTLGYDRARKQLDFWLRRTITGLGGTQRVTWTSTRACPAARPVLASMRNIPVPKFAPIGSSAGPPLVLDGVGYVLSTYSDEGKLTAATNVNTPLALWIEAALKRLDSCWSAVVPERTR